MVSNLRDAFGGLSLAAATRHAAQGPARDAAGDYPLNPAGPAGMIYQPGRRQVCCVRYEARRDEERTEDTSQRRCYGTFGDRQGRGNDAS